MQQDNSSYTVTSPDILLTDDGISILVTSKNPELVDDIKALYEKYIDTSIVVNVQDKNTSENTVSWMWYVSRPCDMMIIDLDTCAWIDVCIAMTKKQDDNHSIVFINQKNKKRDAVRLLNATSEYLILKSIDEFDVYLKSQLGFNS
ncbi:hypothetical protein N9578_00425 [bacterium]|jgi:hypothetical protein|nr:hypothetical protein [bacterium]MDB4128504.1 hypothetical protein [bacterium]